VGTNFPYWQNTMSSLADIPELKGFFSYSRDDDEDARGALSALRDRILRELGMQLGRGRSDFGLFQDKVAIGHGTKWEEEIKDAIAKSVFFIPIVTPRSLRSKHCKYEFELFLAREAELERHDLIFPIHYVRVSALEDEQQWRNDDLLSVVGSRQYLNWVPMRFLDIDSYQVAGEIDKFCANIHRALHRAWESPQERRQKVAAEAKRLQEQEAAERQDREEAQRRAAEDERVRAEEAAKAAAEAERRRIAEEQRIQAEAAEAKRLEETRAAEHRQKEEAQRRAIEAEERARAEAAAKIKIDVGANAAQEERRQEPALSVASASADGAFPTVAVAKLEAPPMTTTRMPTADHFDAKSYSYLMIGAFAALCGVVAGPLTDALGLYGLFVANVAYFVTVQRALYAAGILFLTTSLTTRKGNLSLGIMFVAIYLIEFVSAFVRFGLLAVLQGSIEVSALNFFITSLVLAVTFLIEWLVVCTSYFSLSRGLTDRKMLVTAALAGATLALPFSLRAGLSPAIANGIFRAAQFALAAVLVTYGIRRQQQNAEQKPPPLPT
jgi:TIR domain